MNAAFPITNEHRAVPSGDYGALAVEVTTDDAAAPWMFFATTVDNHTASSSTQIGVP